jgi:hypothetical protein
MDEEEDKIEEKIENELEYDRWDPSLTDGVHINGVMLFSIPDFRFLHANRSWNELIPDLKI